MEAVQMIKLELTDYVARMLARMLAGREIDIGEWRQVEEHLLLKLEDAGIVPADDEEEAV